MQRSEGAETKKEETVQQSGKYGCWEYFALVSVGIFLMAAVSIIVCGFITLRILDGPNWPEDFCMVEDEVYQNLSAIGADWLRTYFEDGEDIRTSDFINVPGDGEHLLLAEYGRLYIRVVWAPRFRFGKAGYIYAVDEFPRMGSDDEVVHLEGNIYCYILDDPG